MLSLLESASNTQVNQTPVGCQTEIWWKPFSEYGWLKASGVPAILRRNKFQCL